MQHDSQSQLISQENPQFWYHDCSGGRKKIRKSNKKQQVFCMLVGKSE